MILSSNFVCLFAHFFAKGNGIRTGEDTDLAGFIKHGQGYLIGCSVKKMV